MVNGVTKYMSAGTAIPLLRRDLVAKFGRDRWSGIVQIVWKMIANGDLYLTWGATTITR